MRYTWLVGWREFQTRVRTRGFLMTSVATPLLLLAIWIASGLLGDPSPPPAALSVVEHSPVLGYVDQAHLITRPGPSASSGRLEAFDDESAARAALQGRRIEAYYVIPPDYRQTGIVRRVSLQLPAQPPSEGAIDWLLAANLLPNRDMETVRRLRQPWGPGGLEFVSLGGTTPDATNMAPLILTILIMIPLLTGGGLLLRSLAMEKGNRIMEILLVSVRPRQLLAGKLLGLGALTLVQYLAWLATYAVVLSVSGQDVRTSLEQVHLSGSTVPLVLALGLGGFAFYAAIMAGVGALAPDIESTRAWIFMINLPMAIPLYLWLAITAEPNGTLAVALSMIPLSAPVGMLLRLLTVKVPAWQVVFCLFLLYGSVFVTIRLTERIFRVQTLLSGESLSPRRIWAVLRTG